MDEMDIFRKLSGGCNYNFKRFRTEAEKLQVIKSSGQQNKPSVDFFKDGDGAKGKCVKRKREGEEPANKKLRKHAEDEETSEDVEDSFEDAIDDDIDDDTDDEEDDDDDEEDDDDDDDDKEEDDDQSSEGDASLDEDRNFTTVDDEDMTLQLMSGMMSKKETKADIKTTKKEEKKKRKKKTVATEAILKQEEINRTRNSHKIHVHGYDVPAPVQSFAELQAEYGLHQQIVENLHKYGYSQPTPVQMQAVPVMLHRREVLACAPTGSGKTAAFIVPILHHLREPMKRGFRALILSPTRELAKQTHREFTRLSEGRGFRIHYIEKSSTAAKKFGPKSAGKFDILITTPNRLVYMLKEGVISLKSVEWLVVDESDKLFEEGKTGFREQLATIYKACDSNSIRRAMFSATFAHDVQEWCKLNLDNVIQVDVGARNAATHTIEQELLFVGSESGKLVAMRNLVQTGFEPPVLVFVQSKDRAKELFQELIYDGINVDVIHSDRTQTQRDNVVKCFRGGKIWVLICTELMGRGIDFKGVNIVINYDFPQTAVSYIHRIGRTGRAGRKGKAVTFFTEDDAVNLRSIANVMREAGCPVPEYMLDMRKPSKKALKKLAKKAPKRDTIRTLPKPDLIKAKRKQEIIKASKQGKSQKVKGAKNKPDSSEPGKQVNKKKKKGKTSKDGAKNVNAKSQSGEAKKSPKKSIEKKNHSTIANVKKTKKLKKPTKE